MCKFAATEQIIRGKFWVFSVKLKKEARRLRVNETKRDTENGSN